MGGADVVGEVWSLSNFVVVIVGFRRLMVLQLWWRLLLPDGVLVLSVDHPYGPEGLGDLVSSETLAKQILMYSHPCSIFKVWFHFEKRIGNPFWHEVVEERKRSDKVEK